MKVTVIGKQKTKYGYIAYCNQYAENDEQIHEGCKCYTCYCKFEPIINEAYKMIYYEKTGKFYLFE